jgi:hypothetical protein
MTLQVAAGSPWWLVAAANLILFLHIAGGSSGSSPARPRCSPAGLGLGLLAAFIVYQATPRDPFVLAGVVLAMLVLGLLATWIPAPRALSDRSADPVARGVDRCGQHRLRESHNDRWHG